ncbi:GNAT family N-acetyltransferase [Halobacillus salinarum]|uniref:GNAT family N-acetyltransferase n=1 Tax=Halobacillus salinarum TaxID=2932257 RepID=A0ABY4EL77_9BACI|nr:GNAT family N-acetyltransferase [Halobacillus salinarum]UOQ44399.1 GNAT family N-acetyltransferase [Halobacillus salinarum]
MRWNYKDFNDLTSIQLYEILQHRTNIFVVEQECPYPEIDGRDPECLHLWLENNGEILAYCRIVPPLTKEEDYAIGRILVAKESRGKGYARELVHKAVEYLSEEQGVSSIFLHGQEHLRHFYGSFGFREVSDVYLEDGIPHVDMRLSL